MYLQKIGGDQNPKFVYVPAPLNSLRRTERPYIVIMMACCQNVLKPIQNRRFQLYFRVIDLIKANYLDFDSYKKQTKYLPNSKSVSPLCKKRVLMYLQKIGGDQNPKFVYVPAPLNSLRRTERPYIVIMMACCQNVLKPIQNRRFQLYFRVIDLIKANYLDFDSYKKQTKYLPNSVLTIGAEVLGSFHGRIENK